MSDAYEQIRETHLKRHSHDNANSDRCKNCGSYVSKPEPQNNQIKYTCNACGRAVLEYHAPAKATSD